MNTKFVETEEIVPNLLKAFGFVAAAGAGVGLMYFLDPTRGNARRARVRDRTTKFAREGTEAIETRMRDLEHRVEGVFAELRHQFECETPVNDSKLEARIHTKLGRVTTNPRTIRIMALSGNVIAGGFAPEVEVPEILKAIAKVPGVKSVESRFVREVTPPAKAAIGVFAPLVAFGSDMAAAISKH